MTTEQAYIRYICSICKNKETELCCIRRKIDNTTYCKGYIKEDNIEGYKKPIYRTANYEHCVMPQLINN